MFLVFATGRWYGDCGGRHVRLVFADRETRHHEQKTEHLLAHSPRRQKARPLHAYWECVDLHRLRLVRLNPLSYHMSQMNDLSATATRQSGRWLVASGRCPTCLIHLPGELVAGKCQHLRSHARSGGRRDGNPRRARGRFCHRGDGRLFVNLLEDEVRWPIIGRTAWSGTCEGKAAVPRA
jgi:hypothetical protein